MNRRVLFIFFGAAVALRLTAQVEPKSLITEPVDENKLVTLQGSLHPLARAGSDLGAVPDSFYAGRMLLLLNRPADRRAALDRFLRDAHTRGSNGFHQWMTPEQFGQRFGAAEADVDAASAWLASHGFEVAKSSKGRQFIEFSGTAGSVREAFHTTIDLYSQNGETQYANASEVKIPEALASLVKGISPLNSFRAKPTLRVVGSAEYAPGSHRTTPQWTLPGGKTTVYALAPEDFATQYDVTPLLKQGVNGAGQTIGIINVSNIDLSLVAAYQRLFGLSSALPQVMIDGSDPGDIEGVDVEAYLDVEEAGAVAPGATINLYIANSSGLFTGIPEQTENVVDPLYLAALRAVDDNEASVLSMSFSNCEGFLLQAGNALWSELWEQAAAQGQTVLVSSNDSGSAGCDDGSDQWITQYGLEVSGLASTPWNVAVGGTDFYYSDYATGGASAAGLWNQTNDADNGSLKAPLTEQVWDTVYGFNAIGPYVQNRSESIPAGGGGASSCIFSDENNTDVGLPFVCGSQGTPALGGYAKPSWQTGTGVPSDGVRDVPDVSLFAAAGTNFSAYPICALDGDCTTSSNGEEQITLVGGTSASTPAMAGIMAMVNQKYGRQGQADFTLYPLAKQVPAAFHDITLGSNDMTCESGKTDCSADNNGDGLFSLQKFAAATGYDLASGLGSVDASVLVNNWNSIVLKPTATSLEISPATAQHGSAVNATVGVKPTSSGGTPTGNVTVLADLTTLSAPPQGVFTLSNGTASGSLSDLPGGTYEVWAEYPGDGNFAASQSAAQTVTIEPAASVVNVYGFEVPGQTLNPAAPCMLNPNQSVYELSTLQENGSSGPFGPWPSGSAFGSDSQVAPVAIVNGAWPSFGMGTGSVTFTLDGAPQATVPLNSYGYTGWIPSSTFNAGSHTIGATYSGDASYASSTATPYAFTVPQVTPSLSAWPAANCSSNALSSSTPSCTFTAGDNLRVEVQMYEANCHVPIGALTVNLGSLSQNVALVRGGLTTRSLDFVGTPVMSGEAVFQSVPAGTYNLTASYAGDVNSLATTSAAQIVSEGQYPATYTVVVTPAPAPLLSSTTTFSVSPSSMDNVFALTVGLSATVTGGAGSTIPPTGMVNFFEDGMDVAWGTLSPAGANSSTVTASADGLLWDIGSSQVKAVYSGDSVYQSSAADETYQFTLPVTPDFLLAPQVRQLTVTAGSSATAGVSLASVNGYSGTVTLTCATASSLITCSLSPATVTVNGLASTSLTVNATAQAGTVATRNKPALPWPTATLALAFGALLIRRARKGALRWLMVVGVLTLVCAGAVSCGGLSGSSGGSKQGNPPPPVPAAAGYNVVVTATANGLEHNTTIGVVVP